MSAIYFRLFLIIFICLSVQGTAQTVTGKVVDRDTGQELPGATVYFDGTSTVAITDDTGSFRITGSGSSTTLVVSFVGYHTARIEDVTRYAGKFLQIEIDIDQQTLGAVTVSKGPFSRKEMLAAFRRQFLGTSEAGKSCVIANEDDLDFHYNVSENSLTASARKPLVIKNKYLKYNIHFDLAELVTVYKKKSLSPHDIHTTYFAGSTLYYDVSKNGNADKRRLQSYLGSAVHLMRTIAHNLWEEEGFSLFVNKKKLRPEDYFKCVPAGSATEVTFIPKSASTPEDNNLEVPAPKPAAEIYFTIPYKEKLSLLHFRQPVLTIDKDGNYSPVYGVVFGGYIGSLKAGDMLPRDYYSSTLAKQIKKH